MDKNQQILGIAQQLFSQFGLKKVTTDDIARKAGVSKATIYKLYKNKEEILKDVVQLECDQLIREIYLVIDKKADTREKLHAYLLVKNQMIHNLVNLYQVTRMSGDSYWPFIHEAQDRYILEEKNIVAKILRDGVKRGEVNVSRVDPAAHVLVIAFRTLEYPWDIEKGDIPLKDHISILLNIIMNGLIKK